MFTTYSFSPQKNGQVSLFSRGSGRTMSTPRDDSAGDEGEVGAVGAAGDFLRLRADATLLSTIELLRIGESAGGN
jgi:hypothetical protein